MHRICILLVACCCLALPANAQKNVTSLQRALTRASTPALTVKTLKITNLPARPSVHILLPTLPHVKHSARLVAYRRVYPLLYKVEERKMFAPRDLVNQTPALYRGLSVANLEELKNILINGLEKNRSNYDKKIFTAYEPLTAVLYAQPNHRFNTTADLPVLLKIPLTPALEQYKPERFATALAFRKNLPAEAISDVWILLEVNQKADWYKAVLDNGEIVLFPAHGQLQDVP